MTTWRILYWLLVGAMLGFGVIAILSIGIIFVLAGLALLTFGAIRFGGKGLWAGLVGFGAAPAALLLRDVSYGWTCQTNGIVTGSGSSGGGNVYTCVNTFLGPLTTYHVLAAGFGALALVGLLWGLATLLWRPRRVGGGLPA